MVVVVKADADVVGCFAIGHLSIHDDAVALKGRDFQPFSNASGPVVYISHPLIRFVNFRWITSTLWISGIFGLWSELWQPVD